MQVEVFAIPPDIISKLYHEFLNIPLKLGMLLKEPTFQWMLENENVWAV